MALKEVKNVTKVSWPVVGSVVVGLVAFGGIMYAINRAPRNAVTAPVKDAAQAIR